MLRDRLALVLLFWSLIFCCPVVLAQEIASNHPLSVEDVVRLSQAGVAQDLIITRIKKNGKAFDLSTDELLALRKSGVSDTVIKYLLDPSQPYAPPAPAPARTPTPAPVSGAPPIPAKAAPPPKQYPSDPYAAKIPEEAGLYGVSPTGPVQIEVRILLAENEGPGIGKLLMKKGKATGYLVGQKSQTRIHNTSPDFYMRLPEGHGIEELVLLSLDRKGDRREIDMGPPSPKPQFKPEAMRQFDSLEVGPKLFKLTIAKLAEGEYFFFFIGSAEPPKGSYGRGYDFGIEPPRPARRSKTR